MNQRLFSNNLLHRQGLSANSNLDLLILSGDLISDAMKKSSNSNTSSFLHSCYWLIEPGLDIDGFTWHEYPCLVLANFFLQLASLKPK